MTCRALVPPGAGDAPPRSGGDVDGSASSDTDGSVVSWAWDFGDGNTGVGVTGSHSYANPGSYTVTLTVTDDDGATAQATHVVTVVAPNVAPAASLTVLPDSGVAPLAVSVDGSASSDTDGSVVSWAWDFGDGNNGVGVTASHSYANPGSYTVTLTVTDDDGATAQATHVVTVVAPNVAPAASLTVLPDSGVAPLAVSVDGSASSDTDGSVVSWAWDFGDGNTGVGVTGSHSYANPGSYTVTLTVTDDDGATAQTTHVVTVVAPNVAPTASFTATPASGTVPLNVAVNASASSDSDGSVVSWAWDFGDSTTGTGVTASHTYTAPGSYTVTLTVTDNLAATGSTTRSVIVNGSTANNKKVTFINGVATIPSTVAGQQATVTLDVKPFVFFGRTLLYFGIANYSDPTANKQGNGLVFLGGSAVARYGLNGAQFTVPGFGSGFRSGPITYKVEDLSAIGGIDKVSVDAGGQLNYHNPGGDVVSGNVTVLPAP